MAPAIPKRQQVVLDELHAKLSTKDPGFFGCQRRNAWDREEGFAYQDYAGNAVLMAFADREFLSTPAGHLEYFTYSDNWVICFRGGLWKESWVTSIYDLWALVRRFSTRPEIAHEVLLITQNQGELNVQVVPIPKYVVPERADALVAGLLADPPSRISKRDDLAHKTCRYCPHRTRCNAFDVLNNDTSDWSESYKKDLSSNHGDCGGWLE